jgi:hypothetical protein
MPYENSSVAASLSTTLIIGYEMLTSQPLSCCQRFTCSSRSRIGLAFPRVAFVIMESIALSLLELLHMIRRRPGCGK